MLSTIRKIWSFHVVVPQRTAMNGNYTCKLEQSNIRPEFAFNSNLPNLIVLNVAFYMHLIRQFDSAHVKCGFKPGLKRYHISERFRKATTYIGSITSRYTRGRGKSSLPCIVDYRYTGRLCPTEVSFSGSRYIKGY